MLRIHIEEQCGSATLRLEGRLAGQWVEELEGCWRNAMARFGGRSLVIELYEVAYVDMAGHSLLATMHAAGAKLVGRGTLSRYLVERIQNHQSGQ